jgi:hypothetical protein
MKIHDKKPLDFRIGVDIGLLLAAMKKGEKVDTLVMEAAWPDALELSSNMAYTLMSVPHSPGELHVIGAPARKPPNPPMFDPTPRAVDQDVAERKAA